MKNGEIYRGLLLSAEDTMNMTLSDVLRTARNGQISKLPSVYLRGSSIRFIALPDLLKNAPVFQKVTTMKRKMEKELQQRQEGEHTIVSIIAVIWILFCSTFLHCHVTYFFSQQEEWRENGEIDNILSFMKKFYNGIQLGFKFMWCIKLQIINIEQKSLIGSACGGLNIF